VSGSHTADKQAHAFYTPEAGQQTGQAGREGQQMGQAAQADRRW
jgi:hypothetical protein